MARSVAIFVIIAMVCLAMLTTPAAAVKPQFAKILEKMKNLQLKSDE
jgi:hypothetical protein